MAGQDDLMSQLMDGVGEPAAERWRTTPLTSDERLIVQNLFDTQPKRRAAYLKQIGFEMNPKDDNQIRPLGSNEPWDHAAEIDPGFVKSYRKGGLAGLLEEAGKKVADNTGTAIEGLAQAGGAAAGATAGLIGTPVGAFLGGALGGSMGIAAAEGMKTAAGDLVLNDNIPTDKKMLAIQSMIGGVIGQGISSAGKWTGELISSQLKKRKDAIVTAAEQAGNGINADLIKKAAENPENWTREAVEGANKRFSNIYKGLVGVDENDVAPTGGFKNLPKDSTLGKIISPLNEQANVEMNKLSIDPKANWNVGDLVNSFDQTLDKLGTQSGRTTDTQAAYQFLKNKRDQVIEDYAKGVPADELSSVSIPYREGRQILTSVQDQAYLKDTPGSAWLKQNAGNLRQLADAKATQAGSNLAEINAQRSNVLSTYDEIRQQLTPTKLKAAFLGDNSHSKMETQLALGKLDALAGTNLSDEVQNGAMQAAIENAYQNPKAFGSGDLKQDMLLKGQEMGKKYGAAGATTGAGIGAAIGHGPGAALGGGIGGAAGYLYGQGKGRAQAAIMSTPATALAEINRLSGAQKAIQDGLDGVDSLPGVSGVIDRLGSNPVVNRALTEDISPKGDSQADDDLMAQLLEGVH